MKLRIVRKPSLTNNPNVFWYHAQVKRFGFWIECRDDVLMMLKYSTDMMSQSWDTNLERVENFVEHAVKGKEMFPHSGNKVIKEYES